MLMLMMAIALQRCPPLDHPVLDVALVCIHLVLLPDIVIYHHTPDFSPCRLFPYRPARQIPLALGPAHVPSADGIPPTLRPRPDPMKPIPNRRSRPRSRPLQEQFRILASCCGMISPSPTELVPVVRPASHPRAPPLVFLGVDHLQRILGHLRRFDHVP